MRMLYHAIMKFCASIRMQPMDLLIGETLIRRSVGLLKQFKIIYELLLSDQPWLKLMQIWHQLTRTGNFNPSLLCLCICSLHLFYFCRYAHLNFLFGSTPADTWRLLLKVISKLWFCALIFQKLLVIFFTRYRYIKICSV